MLKKKKVTYVYINWVMSYIIPNVSNKIQTLKNP